ncbi:alpha/beta fold hydrolase [Ruegeria profundi]|nr:alpha/beta hydrolase [Ruegeria profundi]
MKILSVKLAAAMLIAMTMPSFQATAQESSELSTAAQEWEATGQYITVDGHRIFYHDVGEGPVILLLHGHPSSSYDWSEVVPNLTEKARVISFDHVGWGLSDKPVRFGYSLMELADVTEALVAELGVTEAHVASHDISTSVHTELMARHLEGSLGFTILSSTVFNGSILQWVSSEPDEQNLAQHNETLFEAMRQMEAMGPELPGILDEITLGNLSEDRISMMVELLLRDNGLQRLPAQAVYMRDRYVHSERWVGAMEQISPLRIVWASDDPVANVAIGRELAQRAKQAEYTEIKGIGHFPNAEAPEVIAEQILLGTGL